MRRILTNKHICFGTLALFWLFAQADAGVSQPGANTEGRLVKKTLSSFGTATLGGVTGLVAGVIAGIAAHEQNNSGSDASGVTAALAGGVIGIPIGYTVGAPLGPILFDMKEHGKPSIIAPILGSLAGFGLSTLLIEKSGKAGVAFFLISIPVFSVATQEFSISVKKKRALKK